ncbi:MULTISPECIES: hypothetical protein [unclassified Prochlorococcus]|uniref:hypothetical protein n=1 Tax=unclassified Prochlorococcus TaxID=2627481 RepID=UPI0005338453|nr:MULTISPECIES: hypothetical protein [unclassified Prochlorococcus]KGG26544.1 Serine kinase of the HPr protein [Prochlorococcus sp. MIT 0701]KGG30099.1 Serine kinase of the HPr protein [Prochlorococcus sp. MIT 0702]KGG33244.1 Serine kinase of the HPr protein [Prochlorococcus sp. MIT 0703]
MSESNYHKNLYTAFGLQISSDIQLPELRTEVKAEAGPDQVIIAASSRKDWPAINASDHSTPSLQMIPADWRLELEGIGWFRAHEGRFISWQRWDDSVSDRDLRTFLVSSALGALLIQRGFLVLNGTALVKDGKALLLLGSPASGKSTLAWCLHQQGWQLLSSELTVIDEQGMVLPGMQQLKLWYDAAEELMLDWQQLPLVRKALKRYAILPPDLSVVSEPMPLAVIYGLNRREQKDKNKEEVKDKEEGADDPDAICAWQVIRQQVALLQLRNQAFQPRFYRGMGKEQQLFIQAAALVKRVEVHRLALPDGVKLMKKVLKDKSLEDPVSLAPKQSQAESPEEE